ncbi:MAG: CRP/FNR family transcriptional regulator [Gammaproteobacteria bacterium]|jgi:CRP/FNR family transcriptional regulator
MTHLTISANSNVEAIYSPTWRIDGRVDNSKNACQYCHSLSVCLASPLIAYEDKHQVPKRVYQKGEHVFYSGEPLDALYVVRSGSIKTYMISEQGDENILGFYLPGDVIGIDSGNADEYQSAAVTLESATVCRLPLSRLEEEGAGSVLLKLVADQIQRNQGLNQILAHKDADGRMASFLLDFAVRYWERGYSETSFNLPMARQDIGNYLGLAVETVSRCLTRFQESCVLDVNRREITIQARDQLVKCAVH